MLGLLHGMDETEIHLTTRRDGITVRRLALNLQAEPFSLDMKDAGTNFLVTLLLRELRTVVAAQKVGIDMSGCPYTELRENRGDPIQGAADDLEAVLRGLNESIGDGTKGDPFMYPEKSSVPLSEYKAPGWMTLAWPALFPLGRGDFGETREHTLTWKQWSMHLQKFHDGRFAQHVRFPYFLLNTRERGNANKRASVCALTPPASTSSPLPLLSCFPHPAVMRSLWIFSCPNRAVMVDA